MGLGYVGCVTAACLAEGGWRVIGVDVNPHKVEALNAGRCPLVEPGMPELIRRHVGSGGLRSTVDVEAAVREADLSLVCVGTPSLPDGSLDLAQVRRVVAQIGAALLDKPDYHVVVVRSTVLPGSVESVVLPILQSISGKLVGPDLGLAMNPEFLREGTAVRDFYRPARTVIGEFDARSGDAVAALYRDVSAPLVRTDLRTAELVKYADNAFHALKVTFANEMGTLSQLAGVDGQRLMDIFCLDDKLNISAAYLRPGAPFGGSCLPKDVRALVAYSRQHGVALPVIESILPSNGDHKRRALDLVRRSEARSVGVLGLAFKPDTDDLRESPTLELIQSLLGDGMAVKVYDPNVDPASLIGANKGEVDRALPELRSLLTPDSAELLRDCEVIVVTTADPAYLDLFDDLKPTQTVLDLAGLPGLRERLNGRWLGLHAR